MKIYVWECRCLWRPEIRWFWATMWMMGTKLRSFTRAWSALNAEPSFQLLPLGILRITFHCLLMSIVSEGKPSEVLLRFLGTWQIVSLLVLSRLPFLCVPSLISKYVSLQIISEHGSLWVYSVGKELSFLDVLNNPVRLKNWGTSLLQMFCWFFSVTPLLLEFLLCICWYGWWCLTGLWCSAHFSLVFIICDFQMK